jgi:hypothetical protein
MIDPNDWQRWIVRLLRQRHGLKDLVEVPDTVGGDRGLEAFSRDGCCYQCYAPEGEPSSAERYERCRNKMTEDTRKFVDNAEDLVKIFGDTKIRRWVFVTPVHDNRKLVVHAEKKSAEIRAKSLSYVATDFEIQIATEDHFEIERNLLHNEGLQTVRFQAVNFDNTEIVAFASAHSEQIGKLDQKLAKIIAPSEREDLKATLLKLFLRGEDALAQLRNFPELYEAFIALRGNRELYIARKSATKTIATPQTLEDTIEEFDREIRASIPALHSTLSEALANSSSVGWLLQCPLKFPGDAR